MSALRTAAEDTLEKLKSLREWGEGEGVIVKGSMDFQINNLERALAEKPKPAAYTYEIAWRMRGGVYEDFRPNIALAADTPKIRRGMRNLQPLYVEESE